MKNEIEEEVAKWERDNAVRNLSPDSLETYASSARDFLRYFADVGIKRFKQLTGDVVKGYIAYQQLRECSARTINNRLKALRRLCNFYRKETNRKYKTPAFIFQKETLSARTPCTNEEVYRIIENVSPMRASSVLAAFVLETGVRSKTVRNIRIEDLDLEQRKVLCRVTKNRDPLVLPLSKLTCELLKAYIEHFGLKSGYLFVNSDGGKFHDRSAVYKALTKFLRNDCGLERSGVHLFRYTFCRIMVQNNCNAMILQQWLGHRTMDETKRYVRLYSDELMKVCEEVTPFAENGKFLKNFQKTLDKPLKMSIMKV